MVGNVPWSRANNTPWSLTMVTHHGHTITDHHGSNMLGNQKLWDHDQTVAGTVASIRYTEDCSLHRGSTLSDC